MRIVHGQAAIWPARASANAGPHHSEGQRGRASSDLAQCGMAYCTLTRYVPGWRVFAHAVLATTMELAKMEQ